MRDNPKSPAEANYYEDAYDAMRRELHGKLHLNERSVFERLCIHRISDDFVSSCSFDFSKDSEHNDHFDELRRLVSEAEAGSGASETDMYPHLEYILNFIADFGWNDMKGCGERPRHFLCDFSEDVTESITTLGFPSIQPYISLLDATDASHRNSPERPKESWEPQYLSQWQYCSGFVEMRVSSSDGPITIGGEDIPNIILNAANNARLHMAARPFQLFSIGLLIYGLKFCVAIFDCDGVTLSPEESLLNPEGWDLFLRVVRCMAVTLTAVDLGQDPAVEMLSPSHPAIPALRSDAGLAGMHVSDDFPTLSISAADGSDRRWLTIARIWTSASLVEGHISVWLVKEMEKGTVRVLKTTWTRNQQAPEAIYDALQDVRRHDSHPCLARLYAREVTPRGDKVLCRGLLSAGRPIWLYKSEIELIRGIRAVVQGHKFLYENRILCCDVDPGNVLLAWNSESECEGLIAGLDDAFGSDRFDKVSPGVHIVGTYQFMSTRILDLLLRSTHHPDVEIFHEVRDALESFIWVFFYAIMRHHVVLYPSDYDAHEEFSSIFGHLDLRNIMRARGGLQPFRSMWSFKCSISPQLFQWFIDQFATLARSSIYDLPTGFNFTYETLDSLLDTALSADGAEEGSCGRLGHCLIRLYAAHGNFPGHLGLDAAVSGSVAACPERLLQGTRSSISIFLSSFLRKLSTRARFCPPASGDMSDTIGKWAAGASYGPVLDTTMLYLLKPDLELNPILTNSSNAFQLIFNIASGQTVGFNAEARDRDLPFVMKDEPATLPRVSEIIIITELSPWCTIVRNPNGVTMNDICSTVWKEYTEQMVTDKEYESLPPRLQDQIRRHATNAINNGGWGAYYTPATVPNRFRRVDWLRDKVFFDRLVKKDTYAKGRLGFSAPNVFVMMLNS
ncbi:hypothetical protein NM688_g5197 [Phlebia brevispora]|uniref:Uncharacterized protein n=1 Tax=Phlebia brevispora TaxID=194682 RepID=A0ACC1SYU6_9APHY|nr:hypothetical protein NM688_g5197 [Phlebia brevispora]